MPAKQKVKKSKPAKQPSKDPMMEAFNNLVGEVEKPVEATTSAETTTKKKGNSEALAKGRLNRKPKSELLINVLGRKYTKTELHSKVLQASGKCLIPETILRDNVKRVLHSDKLVDLLPSQKSYTFGSRALPMLKEHIEFSLTNLLYIANVITISKGKTTIGEGEVLLANLIMRGKLHIHGDKSNTQNAVIRSQGKSKRETISLGQDVNIDKIAMILQEALSTKADGEISSTSLLTNTTDKLKKAIVHAEEKFHDILSAQPTIKKRKLIETKEELQEEEEEQEEEQEEQETVEEKVEEKVEEPVVKKVTTKKSTKEEKKKEEVAEPKPKKKKVEVTKKTTKK
ncbi:hypothetical protein NAEGRDRAFT_77910 [Naegleria gruberi]|uniref:Uncharacterized protein n=1 Tax=Naegleria gruberi TaxID=5762 RepID=D2UZD3_NAEGR|nr:uncharacterized protein NAEGRDRAFT_77910 [Naegleria gruberi]EFC50128.1 hypothetical protein NAEGRDRAFT_77910 [Naegleria gruberi]|eukprot:XP_002682872.1 hypothetical protein NAEGRDRAFT_77910 [Naegleria gruberi strain NEG-M]